MNPFEFALTIIVIVFGYKLVTTLIEHREKRQAGSAELEAVQRMQKELAALDDRIQVLERIVTDGRYNLDQEIKDLDCNGFIVTVTMDAFSVSAPASRSTSVSILRSRELSPRSAFCSSPSRPLSPTFCWRCC